MSVTTCPDCIAPHDVIFDDGARVGLGDDANGAFAIVAAEIRARA